MQPMYTEREVLTKTIDDLVATLDLLEIAKDTLIRKDKQEASRLLRIAKSDLGIYERRLRS